MKAKSVSRPRITVAKITTVSKAGKKASWYQVKKNGQVIGEYDTLAEARKSAQLFRARYN